MNGTEFEGEQPIMGAGNRTSKVTIAAIFGAVLIIFILAGCFLTTLIMILDAIPFHAILGH